MIGDGFSQKPELYSPFPEELKYWHCSRNDILVPNNIDDNLSYRERLIKKAAYDPVLQKDLLAACSKSPIYWINTFVYTYHQFDIDDEGNTYPSKHPWHPMVLWKVQRDLIFEFEKAFTDGHDILVDKSRDMGASWCCVIFLHWLWLFRPDTQIRELSRVEDYVDSTSSKSLFWKHDSINRLLPQWMRPPDIMERGRKNRTKLSIFNELNGSAITGESTTKHAMSGDRCSILLLDEFSKVDNGTEIRTATADVTPCRIVNSTPAGAGTEYSRWKHSGQIQVFPLMFWEHPQKGKGRFVVQDNVTKTYNISSPWLEHEKKRRSSKEIAQEILAQDLQSGDTFFSLAEIDKHITLFAREPKSKWNVELKDGIADDQLKEIIRRRDTKVVKSACTNKGKLDVWIELIDGRPDQSKTYIFGIDTSKGQGASESVISIKCKQSGEIIAKWRDRNTPEHEFARIIVALSLWCGGANPQRLPFLKWENNGPGWNVGRLLVKEWKYPFYYCSEATGIVGEKKSDKYGWHASREGKVLLLRAYEQSLMQGKIINHDKRGLEQAKYYIHYPDGGVGPAEVQDKKLAERLLHGDIVMADALTTDDKEVAKPKQVGPKAPFRSWQYRFDEWKKKQRRQDSFERPFNFVS